MKHSEGLLVPIEVSEPHLGKPAQARTYPTVQGCFGKRAARAQLAGGEPGEQCGACIDGRDGIDMEKAFLHRLHHVVPQHQVRHIARGDQHAVLARETAHGADVEKTFDLFVDAADRLDLAVLVHRARYRQGLFDRHLRQRGEQRIQLGRGGAVALHFPIRLFEHQRGRERQGEIRGITPAEKTREDQHALCVDRAAQLDLALDVDHLTFTESHACADAVRHTEIDVAEPYYREAVDLTHGLARGGDQGHAAPYRFVHALSDTAGTTLLRSDCLLHMRRTHYVLARRAMIGFGQEIGDTAQVRGYLFAVAAEAAGLFDDALHVGAVEGPQLALAGHGGDELGEQRLATRLARQVFLKIRGHFEQL